MGQIANAISSGNESRPHLRNDTAHVTARSFRRMFFTALFAFAALFLALLQSPSHADPVPVRGDYNCGPDQYFNTELQACFAGQRPAPVADAGQEQTIDSGQSVTLHAAASNTMGETVSYIWDVLPDADSAQYVNSLWTQLVNSPDSESPTIIAPTLEKGAPDLVLTFSLTVRVSGYGSDDDFLESTSPATVRVTVTAPHDAIVPPPPILSLAEPGHGAVTGGTSITIAGENLNETSAVTISGIPASFTIADDTTLNVITPKAGAAGLTNIVVTTAGGSQTIAFIYDLLPQSGENALALSLPSSSMVYGNTMSVSVQGGQGTGAVAPVGTQGICDVGALTDNQATITATGLGTCAITATKAGDATYEEASVTKVIEVTPPALVTSTNSNPLLASFKVGKQITAFTPVSASGGFGTLSFAVAPKLPAGFNIDPASGEISGTATAAAPDETYIITVSDQASQVSSKSFDLEVKLPPPLPVIGEVVPATGSVLGDTQVTISGSGLEGAVITIDGSTVESAPGASATSLTFTTPAHGAGTVSISITTPGGVASASFTYKLISQTIVAAASPNSIPYEGVSIISVSDQSGSGAINFTVPPDNGVCVLAGNKVTATGVGTCSVTANIASDAVYAAATASVDIEVHKAEQAIKVSAAPSAIVYGGDAMLSVTGGAGTGDVSYDVTDGNCSISGNKVSATGLGTCTLTATKTADAKFTAATAETSIDVSAPALLTTLDANASSMSFTVGEHIAGFTPVSASGGFGALSFAVAPALPAGLAINAATGVITGTPSVAAAAADYAVNVSDHSPTPQVSFGSFNLRVDAPVPVTAITSVSPVSGETIGGTTLNISGANFTGTTAVSFGGIAAASFKVNSDTSISATSPRHVAGVVDIAVTVPTGAVTATHVFTYVLTAQTISFTSAAPGNATVGGGTTSISANATSGLSVTFTSGSEAVCTVAGSTVSLIGPGTCIINADQAGDNYYVAAAQKQQSFKVTGQQTAEDLDLPSTTVPPGQHSINLPIKTPKGVALSYDVSPPSVCSIEGNGKLTFLKAGECAVTPTQQATGDLVALQLAPVTFSLGLASQSITFGNLPDTSISDAPPTLSATASSGLAVSYVSQTTGACTIGSSAGKSIVNFAAAGDCTIAASQAGDGFYSAADSVTRTYTIIPPPRASINAKPVVNAGDDKIIYSDETIQFLATASDSDNDPLTYQWELLGEPAGQLTGASVLAATYRAPHLQPGSDNLVLTFKLTVTDGKDSASDTVSVTIKPQSGSGKGSLTVAGGVTDIVPTGPVTLTFSYAPMTDHSSLGSLTMFGAVSPIADLLQLAIINTGVTFYDGSVVLCANVSLVNNKASCTVNLSPGPHNLRAVYNNGEVSVEPASDTLIVTAVDKAGPTAKAIGSFFSDRANLIVTNLPGMDRQIDRLNAAQAAKGGLDSSSNLAASGKDDLWLSGKGDLLPLEKSDLMLSTSRLGSGPSGASITASRLGVSSSVGATNVGQQDMLGFQSFLYNYLRSSGESGNFGRFNFSGPMDMQANFISGSSQASFKTSLSQMMAWQQQREHDDMSSLGFGTGRAPETFMPFDVWMEGAYSSYSGTRSGTFGMATVGADYVFNPSFLAGFYGQFDAIAQSTSAVDGRGWMIGPYVTARISENVFWQGRAGWGKSSNTINLDGSGADNFGSRRWLVSSSLSGKWRLGDGFAFAPSASFSYFEDKSDGYVDHLGVNIPGVKTNLGQVKLSPELSYGILTDNDLWIEPSLATELIWNFASTDVDGLGSLDDDDTGPAGLRGRVRAGLNVRMPSGILLGASGTYDGIGFGDYSAIAGQMTVSVPLN